MHETGGKVRLQARAGSEPATASGRLATVKLLAFSDLHRDLAQGAKLVEMAADADLVIGAGDFASVHEGLEETIAALAPIEAPTVLVPGNNETADALRAVAAGWAAATVLHGAGTTIEGTEFFGLGAGIPVTPWEWSFDLDEKEAAAMLAPCPENAVLVLHSPPRGHCDAAADGTSFGSPALLRAIEEKRPRLAVCGHIHESWGCESEIGPTPVRNLGPRGTWIEL
jgi:Icc-related predicted phosphoesterase